MSGWSKPGLCSAAIAEMAKLFDEKRAYAVLRKIHRSDSRSTTDAYARTAEMAAELMRSYGMQEVGTVAHKADGRSMVYDWLASPAWTASRAELRALGPLSVRGVLARYPDTPTCLAVNSPGTPREGVTGPLVAEEALRSPQGAAGKFVLTKEFPSRVRAKYREAGILGIVSDAVSGGAGAAGRPDTATYWDNCWHSPWPGSKGVCFMIPPREGARLREAMRRGKRITLFARADAVNYVGEVSNVTGIIPGRDRGMEVIGVGHLFEVGANDNASGAAVLLETARCLVRLAKRRPFRRSVRILLPFECYGTLAYLGARKARELLAGINLDMVGEDQAKCRSVLNISAGPEASAGFSEALIHSIFRSLPGEGGGFRWREAGFIVDDNALLGDPLVGCPTPLLLNQPDRFYHSDQDTPDKVDPAALRRTGLAAGAYLAWLARAGAGDIPALAGQVLVWSKRRLSAEARTHRLGLDGGAGTRQRAKVRRLAGEAFGFWLDRTQARLKSVRRLAAGAKARASDGVAAAMREARRLVLRQAKALGTRIPGFARGGSIPTRLSAGVPALNGKAGLNERIRKACGDSFPWSAYLVSALFWADGKRGIDEIADRLKREFGRGSPRDLRKVLALLEEGGYVRLRSGNGRGRGGK